MNIIGQGQQLRRGWVQGSGCRNCPKPLSLAAGQGMDGEESPQFYWTYGDLRAHWLTDETSD